MRAGELEVSLRNVSPAQYVASATGQRRTSSLVLPPRLPRVRGLLDQLEASRLRDRNPALMAAAECILSYGGAER